jgi:hypothetical protein
LGSQPARQCPSLYTGLRNEKEEAEIKREEEVKVRRFKEEVEKERRREKGFRITGKGLKTKTEIRK